MTQDQLLQLLFEHKDEKYADFSAKLIPTVPRDHFIGIRSPEYKKILKVIKGDPVIPVFMNTLPHFWHEENCLHAALINRISDYDTCITEIERFLPFINNWAVNDGLNPPVFEKHHDNLIVKAEEWISSDAVYTRRFGLHILMSHFLDDDFKTEYLIPPSQIRSEEYYVNMMIAWLFAEALAKQWNAAVTYIEQQKLDAWTHNKAIQKACESYRITNEQKSYLRTLKVKIHKEKIETKV